MIAYLASLFSGLFGSAKKKRAAYDNGFDQTASVINSLRENDEYEPSIPFTARARVIASFKGSDQEFSAYQEGMRDAIVVYEREFGAP
jgi:hypothetical protein